MISNSGSNENGKVYGGKPGDQTGREWQIRTWYSRPWKCVLHHPDAKVRALIAEYAEQAAKNNLIGYNQLKRLTFWEQLKKSGYDPAKITTACDADCSAGVCGIVKAVGYTLGNEKLKAVSEKLVTSQMRSALKKAGFTVYTASKYLTSDKYLARGDILLNDEHHTAINLANGTTSKTTTAPASKNPYSEPNYTVMRGSTGSGVKWVQWELTRIKYSVGSSGIDGIFGKDTYAAVLKFQKKWFSSSKEWDGIVGRKTRAALKSA